MLPGESWLDLGANVGAFAVYCAFKSANVECYEPDPNCYRLLQLNAPAALKHNAAVSVERGHSLAFHVSRDTDTHSRGTLLKTRSSLRDGGSVANVHAERLGAYDGVKMDIEGSEGPIIDANLVPRCRKLVMEYHTSVDPSVTNFDRRMGRLASQFRHVVYPPEFQRAIDGGLERFKSYYDRQVWCWND